MGQPPHGLDVLRKHFGPRIDDGLDIAQHALEIRRQRLDGGRGRAMLDGADAGRVVRRAAIGQIIAID